MIQQKIELFLCDSKIKKIQKEEDTQNPAICSQPRANDPSPLRLRPGCRSYLTGTSSDFIQLELPGQRGHSESSSGLLISSDKGVGDAGETA